MSPQLFSRLTLRYIAAGHEMVVREGGDGSHVLGSSASRTCPWSSARAPAHRSGRASRRRPSGVLRGLRPGDLLGHRTRRVIRGDHRLLSDQPGREIPGRPGRVHRRWFTAGEVSWEWTYAW